MLLTLACLAGCAAPPELPEPSEQEPIAPAETAPELPASNAPAGLMNLTGLPEAWHGSAVAELIEPSAPTVHQQEFLVAEPLRRRTAVFALPMPDADPVAWFRNAVWDGANTRLAVLEQQDDWVLVVMPGARVAEPGEGTAREASGSVGWVRAIDVSLHPVEYRIEVRVDDARLLVLDASGTALIDTAVVVGAPGDTPTPRDVVSAVLAVDSDCAEQPWTCRGAVDRIVYSASRSPVLEEYRGAGGNVAAHFYAPGGSASHGCVRLDFETAAWMQEHIVSGTRWDFL